jgi:fructokinase
MDSRRVPFTVVGLGEVLWDLLPTGPQLGGAPANFAYHAAALGADATVVTRVGDDDRGRGVIERFEQMNLRREAVQIDPVRPTGTVAVSVDEGGVAHYEFPDNVAWEKLAATKVALRAVRGAHAVCFGTLAQRSATSRATIQQLVATAADDALKIFDINLRLNFYTREVIEQSMRLANVLKLNDEELSVLTALFSLQGTVRQRLEWLGRTFGLRIVVLTSGPLGSLIHQEGNWSQMPPQPVRVVDTVGAGDAFAAALAIGVLNGLGLDEVHENAANVARYVCTESGGTPRLPGTLLRKFHHRLS